MSTGNSRKTHAATLDEPHLVPSPRFGRPVFDDSFSAVSRQPLPALSQRMSQVRSLQHPPSDQAWRHAKAAALLRQAVPLKVIGDVFAHRSATSTMAYLKLDVEQLRGIALELPESVRTLSDGSMKTSSNGWSHDQRLLPCRI
jgi:hypothetical protein